MQGEFVTLRADLLAAPAFSRIGRRVGLSDAELLHALYRLAGWFEVFSKYGQMPDSDAKAVDTLVNVEGFFDAMKRNGWIKSENGVTWLSGFCIPSKTRKSPSQKVRDEVLAAGKCKACESTSDLVVDHIIPIVRGGSNDTDNLQALCGPCNRKKWRMTMEEFLSSSSAPGG